MEDNFFPKSFKKTNVGISLPRRRWNPGHNRGHFSIFSFFATMLVHKDPHSVWVIVIQLNLFCFLTEISAERKGLWTPKKIVQDTKVFFKLSEFLSSQSFHAQYFVVIDHDHEPTFMHEQFVPSLMSFVSDHGKCKNLLISNCYHIFQTCFRRTVGDGGAKN